MLQPEAPPVGLMPRWRWIEMRIEDIFSAMCRYTHARKRFPDEWLKELSEHEVWLTDNYPRSVYARKP